MNFSIIILYIPQGVILSSFYWGYTLTQVLGGRLSDRHSGEMVQWLFGIGWSTAILSVTILANISDILVIMANFVNGLSQGTCIYCMKYIILVL